MKAITLRNIPPELAAAIEKKALEENRSLNQTVLEMLADVVKLGDGDAPGTKRRNDVSFLVGAWGPEEAAEFQKSLEFQRQIDWEMWK